MDGRAWHTRVDKIYFCNIIIRFQMRQQDLLNRSQGQWFPKHAMSPDKEAGSRFSVGGNQQFSPHSLRGQIQQSKVSAPTIGYRPPQGVADFFTGSKVETRDNKTTLLQGTRSRFRTNDQIQSENSFWLQQIAQKDELIRSLKQGKINYQEAPSQQLVNSLNLKLASKNFLLEKINKQMADFTQTVRSKQIELLPQCQRNLGLIEQWVEENDKQPVIVKERLIETSRQAEKHYVFKQDSQLQLSSKLQQSRIEANNLKEKVSLHENQQMKANQMIQQMQQKHAKEVERMNSTIASLNAEISAKAQNSRKQRNSRNIEEKCNDLATQNVNYKNQLNKCTQLINQQRKELQIHSKKMIQLNDENQSLIEKINKFKSENSLLNLQISQRKSEESQNKAQLSNYVKQLNLFKKDHERLQGEIEILKKNNSQKTQNPQAQKPLRTQSSNSDEWKVKYQELSEECSRYKEQINYLNFQVKDIKSKSSTPLNKQTMYMATEDNSKHIKEIASWRVKCSQLADKCQQLQSKNSLLAATNKDLQNWRMQYENSQFQINDLQRQINSLNSRVRRYEDEENYSILEWKIKYEEAISSLRQTKTKLQQERLQSTQTLLSQSPKKEEVSRYAEETEQFKKMYGNAKIQMNQLEIEKMNWSSEKNQLLSQQRQLTYQLEAKTSMEEAHRRREEQFQQQQQLMIKQLQQTQQLQWKLQSGQLQRQLRQELELQLRNELQTQIKERTEKQHQEFYEAKFKIILEDILEEERMKNQQQWNNRQQQLLFQFETQEKERIYDKVNRLVRTNMFDEIYNNVQAEFETITTQTQSKLTEAEKYIEKLVGETEKLSVIIVGLQQKFSQLLKRQSTPQEEQIKELESKIKEQEMIIMKGRQFLERAERHIETLMKQLEERGQTIDQQSKDNSNAFEFKINQLNSIILSNQAEINTLNLTISQLEKLHGQAYQKLAQAQDYIATLMSENEHLKKNLQTVQQKQYILHHEEGNKWGHEDLRLMGDKEESEEMATGNNWNISGISQNFNGEREQWEEQRRQWNYEREYLMKEVEANKNNLVKAEDYIVSSAKDYEQRINKLSAELHGYRIKYPSTEDDEFRYMIDARFELLSKKMMELALWQSSQTQTEAELLKLYVAKRQEQSEAMRRKIKEGLEYTKEFEQVLVLRRSEFKRLNLANLSEFINYIDRIRSTEVDTQMVGSEQFLRLLRQVYDA